jgi:hypothetical protein
VLEDLYRWGIVTNTSAALALGRATRAYQAGLLYSLLGPLASSPAMVQVANLALNPTLNAASEFLATIPAPL